MKMFSVRAIIWLGMVVYVFTHDLYADPVAESLKSSPWYEYAKKDYHKYKQDEIKIPEQKKPSPKPREQPNYDLAWMSQNLISSIFIGLAAIAILIILFFIYKYFKENKTHKIQSVDIGEIQVMDLPDNILKKIQAHKIPDLAELTRRIEDALSTNNWELAAICIYLYVLLTLQKKSGLRIKKNLTARDYLTQYKLLGQEFQIYELIFMQTVIINFEYAMYRGNVKDASAIPALWKSVKEVDLKEKQNQPGPKA